VISITKVGHGYKHFANILNGIDNLIPQQ